MAVRGTFGREGLGGGVAGPPITRRRLLEYSAAVGVFAPAGLAPTQRGAFRTVADPTITLTFQPWQYAYGFQTLTSLNSLLYEATSSFRAGHPSVRIAFFGPEINPYTSVIAGEGPDIPQLQGGGGGITDWISGPLGTLLMDLTPYIKQSNINLNDFVPENLLDVTYDGKLYALPNYTGTSGMVVNLSVLDQLGAKYPDRQWNYLEYERLCRAVSGSLPHEQWRYGTTFTTSFGPGPDVFYYHGWGGTQRSPSNPELCTLDSPQCTSCAEFIFNMIFDKTAEWGRIPGNAFQQGQVVAPIFWLQSYIIPAATQWRNFNWDFWPAPRWPVRPANMTNYNYFAIAANTRYPEAAWELFHWLTVEPDWQRTLMRTVLLSPGYLPLWPEYVDVVKTVAPSLRNKHLEVFQEALTNAVMVGGQHFGNSEVQAQALISAGYTAINDRKASVAAGLRQMTASVNALEAAGNKLIVAEKAAFARTQAYVAKARAGVIEFPQPERFAAGSGTPPTAAGSRVQVGTGGQVRLLGSGGAVQGRNDNCVFAGSAFTSSRGEVMCRLVSVALQKGGAFANFPTSKAGLMARSSLGNQSAAVAVFFGGNRGVHAFGRPEEGFNLSDERSGATPGLLTQQAVQVAKTPGAGSNWLLRPIWFKLAVNDNVWTPYTSLDGHTWAMAGTPQLVEFVGAWVGLFATSTKASEPLVAMFDHLTGFRPGTQVVVGKL